MSGVTEAPAPGAWIGEPPTPGQVASALAVGVVGVMVAGLQPVMLGALAASGAITTAQIGHAATLELLGLGVGAGAAGSLLEGRSLRVAGIAAGVALAVANLSTLAVRGEGVALVRGLAGLPGGAMIWIVTSLIVRSPRPARWSGAYLTIQTLAQLVAAALLGVLALGRPEATPLVLAGMGAIAAVAALGLPRKVMPLPREETASGLPPPRGWTVLAAAVLLQACIVGAWVYLEPLGAQARLPAVTIAAATPISLAAQVLGGACATLAAGRLSWFGALIVSGLVLTGATLGLSTLPPAGVFLALEALFGFAWLFILPFLAPLAIEADPTRRTALLGPAANLVGAGIGPLLASSLVGDSDARAALHLCAGLAVAGMGLIFALHLTRRRALSPA